MAVLFEGEKLPGEDEELRMGARGDEFLNITKDQIDVAVLAKAFIDGLRGSMKSRPAATYASASKRFTEKLVEIMV